MNKEAEKLLPANQEDDMLIKSFLAEDVQAFDKLVIKYKDIVFSLCYRIIGNYDDADDCSQETFIKVYNNLKNFKFKSSFPTWLYRITVNTCRNRISSSENRMKKNSIRIDYPSENSGNPLDIRDNSYNPNIVFEKNEMKRLIQTAINLLPKDLKVLIVLRDIEQKSYEDIAEITKVNLGTVKSRLARARHQLREQLREVIK